MKNFIARMAYYTSLGFDTSEYPVAGIKQKEREKLLKQRIGTKAFKQFDDSDSGAIHDPAFWAHFLVPLSIAGAFGVLLFCLIVGRIG